jgi:RNA recognition motif-containing protein
MNIYIGNLSYEINEEQLKQLFEEFGEVTSANIIIDKYSGRSKGFGFVEMTDSDAGKAAISALNGKTVKNREITVNEARPKSENDNYSGNKGRY